MRGNECRALRACRQSGGQEGERERERERDGGVKWREQGQRTSADLTLLNVPGVDKCLFNDLRYG